MDDDRVALVDLDGTIADYDGGLKEWMAPLMGPDEAPYAGRLEADSVSAPHLEARRKLIQRVPGFWRGLGRHALGWRALEMIREAGFPIHVLTKGPKKTPIAWAEKVEWCLEHLPDTDVTITAKKSMVYGRVLLDDYPPYFLPWLKHRPRGIAICVSQPWNSSFPLKLNGIPRPEPEARVLRYDGSNDDEVRSVLKWAFERKDGE